MSRQMKRARACSWSTSSSPVIMILFSIRVSEYPPFTVCNTKRLAFKQMQERNQTWLCSLIYLDNVRGCRSDVFSDEDGRTRRLSA